MNHRRNNPIRINVNDDEIVILFLNLLCREPFLETFYFADAVAPPIPIPHGKKGTRQRAALARLNSDEFHLRNHSGDRRFTDVTLEITRIEIFRKYHEPNHGNMNVDCCLLIENILHQINQIRQEQNQHQLVQEEAVQARYACTILHINLINTIIIC